MANWYNGFDQKDFEETIKMASYAIGQTFEMYMALLAHQMDCSPASVLMKESLHRLPLR
jgi:hypothetical protein